MTIDNILDGVLKREAGYVDNPADKGGPTKYGITQATLSGWRGKPVTAADVEAMTEAEARLILRSEYVVRPGFEQMKEGALKDLIVDCAVNHGPERAIKLLQKALGVVPDGIFGPVTREALSQAYSWAVYYGVCAERVRFYGKIISNDHSQAEFAEGWANRVAEFIERA